MCLVVMLNVVLQLLNVFCISLDRGLSTLHLLVYYSKMILFFVYFSLMCLVVYLYLVIQIFWIYL